MLWACQNSLEADWALVLPGSKHASSARPSNWCALRNPPRPRPSFRPSSSVSIFRERGRGRGGTVSGVSHGEFINGFAAKFLRSYCKLVVRSCSHLRSELGTAESGPAKSVPVTGRSLIAGSVHFLVSEWPSANDSAPLLP